METVTAFLTELAQSSLNNIYAVAAFAITTMIAIIALAYSRRQDKRAEIQDATTPSLSLDFFGFSDDDVKDYFFLLPFREKRAIVMPLIFDIGNEGTASAEDVELYFQVSEQLYRSDGTARHPPAFATAREMKHAVDPVTGTKKVQVFLNCKSIGPSFLFRFADIVFVERETFLQQNIPVETKDHVKLKFTSYLYAWFEISISVMAKNMPPQTKRFNLHFRNLHHNPEADFLREEVRRRSTSSLKGVNEGFREQVLFAPTVKKLMQSLGMAYDVDQQLPNKFAVVWFETEDWPDFVSKDDLPEGHDVVAVSNEKVRVLSAQNVSQKKKKKKRKR